MDMAGLITEYGLELLDGALLTLALVAFAAVAGLILAVPIALARVSDNPLIAVPAYLYTYVFRGTPLFVQLFLIYYGLGQFILLRGTFITEIVDEALFWGAVVLTLNTAAYTAEIIRGGIRGVAGGEVEAARAAGMSRSQVYRRIVLPQAVRIAWPAYGNETILLLKSSALVSEITVNDLMQKTRTINADTYDFGIFLWAAVAYFIIAGVLTAVFRLIERRLNRHLRTPAPVRAAPAGSTA